MTWEYQQPVRIRFGQNEASCIGEELRKLNVSRALLVTSPSFERRGETTKLMAQADGRIACVFSQVSPNPDVSESDACADIIRHRRCDAVVALGGGSVIDCAKAACVVATASLPTADYLFGSTPLPDSHLPLIALPTTAGTGSEVTCVSVLSLHSEKRKSAFSHPHFYPTLAIIDPLFTLSVPPGLTAITGFDVICHAVEAYWSRQHQPACDALAVHALRLALGHLEKAAMEPWDIAAREAMAEASVTAGLAFTLPKTSAPHACSYPLTARYDIPHGEACAMTLTHFARFNADNGCERVDTMARLVGMKDAHQLSDRIDQMKRNTGMRMNLKALHLTSDDVDALVEMSHHPNLRNNPVYINDDMLRGMYSSLCL